MLHIDSRLTDAQEIMKLTKYAKKKYGTKIYLRAHVAVNWVCVPGFIRNVNI